MSSPTCPPAIDIIYAAHTASCSFLLDSDGICRRIVVAPNGKRSASRTASRCVGAQYVASLDGSAAGGLVEMPRVGAAMLFARVDENGRISLVRTAVVTSFESNAAEDPFAESGSGAVETSAPEIDSHRTPPHQELEDDYYDPSERTQRIQALRHDQIAAALGEDHEAEEAPELATAEYEAVDESAAYRRTPTLRAAPRGTRADDLDDADDYAKPTAPPPGRSALPHVGGAGPTTARAYALAPRAMPSSDVQLNRRHRGR